jgi:hypothetical protein
MNLSFLKPLYDRHGPFASVYLDMRRTDEEAARAIEVRWHARRKELADQGTPAETIDAVESVVRDVRDGRESGCLAVFAAGGEVAHRELMTGEPRADLARYSPLPHVLPMLAQRGERISHLVAVAHRDGAEMTCVDVDGNPWRAEVPPEADFPLHKSKTGDPMSQPRHQRAAEDAWRANAKKIARAMERTAENCAADVVVLAGDVRMRAEVLEELSEAIRARTVESERTGGPLVDADVERAVELKRTEWSTDVLERFDAQLGKRRAVDGLTGAVEALRKAQVAVLLVEDGADVEETLWTGPQPTDIATSPDDLRTLNIADPVADRADAALIRALAGTDGDLAMFPPGGPSTVHGVGALLRFPDAPEA